MIALANCWSSWGAMKHTVTETTLIHFHLSRLHNHWHLNMHSCSKLTLYTVPKAPSPSSPTISQNSSGFWLGIFSWFLVDFFSPFPLRNIRKMFDILTRLGGFLHLQLTSIDRDIQQKLIMRKGKEMGDCVLVFTDTKYLYHRKEYSTNIFSQCSPFSDKLMMTY